MSSPVYSTQVYHRKMHLPHLGPHGGRFWCHYYTEGGRGYRIAVDAATMDGLRPLAVLWDIIPGQGLAGLINMAMDLALEPHERPYFDGHTYPSVRIVQNSKALQGVPVPPGRDSVHGNLAVRYAIVYAPLEQSHWVLMAPDLDLEEEVYA